MNPRSRFRATLAVAAMLLALATSGCSERTRPQPASDGSDTTITGTTTSQVEARAFAVSAPYGAFAYADTSGTRLLALAALAKPEAIVEAVCHSGVRRAVRYAGYQPELPDNDHRQRAYNFSNEPGHVYLTNDAPVKPDETCFLATDSLLLTGSLALAGGSSRLAICPSSDSARMALAKNRAVLSCTPLFDSDSLFYVAALQFETRAESALASIALVDSSRIAFYDFPAITTGDGDVWRADDGGRFHPEHFFVLFAISGPASQVVAFTWGAAEGESLTLARTSSPSDSLVELMKAYRYWSP